MLNRREVVDYFLNLSITGFRFNDDGDQKVLCPKCSKLRKHKGEPCLSINVSKGVYNCHNCGWTGGFLQKTFKPIVVKDLAAPEEPLYKYLMQRGISRATIDKARIQMVKRHGKSYMAFCYYLDNELVNVKYRSREKLFFQEEGGAQVLYMIDEDACRNSSELVLVEGEIDALTLYGLGIKNVASIPSGAIQVNSKNVDKKLEFLETCYHFFDDKDKIVLALDNDAHGVRTRDEIARRVGKERCVIVDYPEGCKDANDVLKDKGADYLAMIIEESKPYPISGAFTPMDYKSYFDEIYEKGHAKGVTVGWEDFDKLFTWHRSMLTVITGIPQSGKSSYLDNLLVRLSAMNGWKIGMFTPEHYPAHLHLERLSSILLEKPFLPGRNGRMTREEKDNAMDFFEEYISYIVPEGENYSLKDVLTIAEYMVKKKGIDALVIDPWSYIAKNVGNSEHQFVTEKLTEIKAKSRDWDIHIIIVAHPRKIETAKVSKSGGFDTFRIPTLYDISGSAAWYNIPDNGIVVHRHPNTNPQYEHTEVRVRKVKYDWIGELGSCKFKYERANSVFEPLPKNFRIPEETPWDG